MARNPQAIIDALKQRLGLVRTGIMRIAYILNTLAMGGAERQVIALSERMAARGHAVMIVALREMRANEMPARVEIRHLGIRKNPVSALRGYLRAVRILRAFRPDILHSHNVHGNLFARALKLFFPRIQVVSTIHNEYEGGWLRMFAYRITDPLSYCTVAVSEAAADHAIRVRAVPRRKCSVIVNGIDCAEFTPDSARRYDMRANLGVANKFIWLTAGRVVPAKDYPNLLRAFALVHAATPFNQLWIAGEGNSGYTATLHELGTQLNLDAAICWLGARNDMPALLDAADTFVLASAWEGMPLALAEAMAMGKAVVATDVGGVRELVGDYGELVPAQDPRALANAMLHIVQAPLEARESLGQSARRRVLESFNIEMQAAKWEARYREVVAPSTG